MLIEQPPITYRMLFPGAIWRINKSEKCVCLTFDDGPVPEITTWVLDVLDRYNVKATFFCVGDNVRKYPEIYRQLLDRGHRVGNHTFHHKQGLSCRTKNFVLNTALANRYIDSKLFRPPHGHMRFRQLLKLRKDHKVIMWDVVTRDYSYRLNAEQVFQIVKKYTRNGSIVVFHDSKKAESRLKEALPKSIEWLLQQGYTFKLFDD